MIFCRLAESFGFSHQQVSDMTQVQQIMYLTHAATMGQRRGVNPRTGKPTIVYNSLAEMQAAMT
jgi:hypothetical protein